MSVFGLFFMQLGTENIAKTVDPGLKFVLRLGVQEKIDRKVLIIN